VDARFSVERMGADYLSVYADASHTANPAAHLEA
jgi:hypothetical protein